ncbi:MAG: hypothetical protein IJC07_05530 [Clostridia bacterium]|nr:hypothetical protein [Clostridia bacterium]
MNQTILTWTNKILIKFGCDRVLLIFALGQLLAFSIVLVLSLCVYDFSIKKRTWFFGVIGLINCFCYATFSIVQAGQTYFIINFGLSLLLIAPILSVRERKRVIGEKELELARMLTNKAKERCVENFEDKHPKLFEQPNIKYSEQKPSDLSDCGLDFSHVKNVLNRMEYFPLNTAEKKQVSDLNALIYSAENGVKDDRINEKINDGLGALLKIMSKHGA